MWRWREDVSRQGGWDPDCLDADFYTQNNFGYIQQYDCNTSDSFQLWSIRHNVK
jgi:hypothetical protein